LSEAYDRIASKRKDLRSIPTPTRPNQAQIIRLLRLKLAPTKTILRQLITIRRTTTIARRPHNAPPQRETGPRINDRIRSPEIRLIGADGENVGVVTPARAMQMAEEAGLDLVEISPNAEPPVCKIMDFGKFKYEQQKREAEARKKQHIIEIKEIKFRPGTDTHDYDVKMRSVLKFLEEGDKVKVTLRFRGREMAHQQLGLELLNRVAADVGEAGKIESMPRLEGRQMVMMVTPK
jgi:translation initiation factor IF-3